MADITVKKLSDCDYYKGEHAIPGIRFRSVGRDLGVTAWGMNVLEIEPGRTGYPEHDHAKDGQEEVYVVLKGSAILVTIDGEQSLETGMLVRVEPHMKRQFLPGKDGLTLLAIGGTPGQAYPKRA